MAQPYEQINSHRSTEKSEPSAITTTGAEIWQQQAQGYYPYLSSLAAPGPTDLGQLGFPSPNMEGFDQRATENSTREKVWHGIKSVFGFHNDSIEDKLKEHTLNHLSKEEKCTYDTEEKALAEYRRKLVAIAAQASFLHFDLPVPPDMPMHREVDHRTAKLEKKIGDQVRSEMSQHDRDRLDQKTKEYREAYSEKMRIHNPYGTGEGFKFPPPLPKSLEDYWERVREAADAELNKP